MSQELSQEFINMIESSNRKFYGKAVFETEEYSSSYAVDASEALNSARLSELNDGIYDVNSRIASAEPNRFKLDGRTRVHNPGSNYNYGYISSQMSESNGSFTTPIEITITIAVPTDSTLISLPLTILFDTMEKTYPIDFDVLIKFDNATDELIEVRDNALNSFYYLENNRLKRKTEVVITIYNWSESYTRARISEVSLSVIKEYSPDADDKLLSYSFTTEVDILFERLVGNNASIEILNDDHVFNVLSDDGLGLYFTEGVKVSIYVGIRKSDLSYEFLKLSTLFLKRWYVQGYKAVFDLQDFFSYLEGFDARSNLVEAVG